MLEHDLPRPIVAGADGDAGSADDPDKETLDAEEEELPLEDAEEEDSEGTDSKDEM